MREVTWHFLIWLINFAADPRPEKWFIFSNLSAAGDLPDGMVRIALGLHRLVDKVAPQLQGVKQRRREGAPFNSVYIRYSVRSPRGIFGHRMHQKSSLSGLESESVPAEAIQ